MNDNAGCISPRKKRRATRIFWLLCALMLISLVVAANSLVVFTWFHRIPSVLLVLCSLVILPAGTGIFWRIMALLPACFIAILLYWLLQFFLPENSSANIHRHQVKNIWSLSMTMPVDRPSIVAILFLCYRLQLQTLRAQQRYFSGVSNGCRMMKYAFSDPMTQFRSISRFTDKFALVWITRIV